MCSASRLTQGDRQGIASTGTVIRRLPDRRAQGGNGVQHRSAVLSPAEWFHGPPHLRFEPGGAFRVQESPHCGRIDDETGVRRPAGGCSRQVNATPFASCRPRRDAGAGLRPPCNMASNVKDRADEYEERPPDDDYFEIRVGYTRYEVSARTAAAVMRDLSRWWPSRWVGFVDLHGARVRIRSRLITMIHESTALRRQRERDFDRARRLEEKADRRPWEDED
jgi:hypothetical protein